MKLQEQLEELKKRFGTDKEDLLIKACVAAIYFNTGKVDGLTEGDIFITEFLDEHMKTYVKWGTRI